MLFRGSLFGVSMKAEGIDHVELRVSHYELSVRFYNRILLPLGFKKVHIKGETVTCYVKGRSSLGIRPVKKRKSIRNISYSYKRAGIHHVAISVGARREVDEFYRLLLAEKIKVLYPPRKYSRYGRWYYSVFFLDPDGIDLEVLCWNMPRAD